MTLEQYLLAHAENVIIILVAYSVLMTSLISILLMMNFAESGFQDETGYHSYQDAYERAKKELQHESDRADSLEEANEIMYDKGFKDGNLSAIKEIGKEMIADHVKNIEALEELPSHEKMGHKPKQLRPKMVHKIGLKVNDMNALADFKEVENA